MFKNRHSIIAAHVQAAKQKLLLGKGDVAKTKEPKVTAAHLIPSRKQLENLGIKGEVGAVVHNMANAGLTMASAMDKKNFVNMAATSPVAQKLIEMGLVESVLDYANGKTTLSAAIKEGASSVLDEALNQVVKTGCFGLFKKCKK